ncbi:energy-coupling factor transport system permease protein [Allocatelliglobosispora scoriae]|uniref:Energy-coupling factor transport system permease protein n=1 Tax=Allocatelliglobosispora scoriae TaxID=643052 RepID=A0A841BKX4_9ACTN|nr:energy-coupling factor transporter transmembrane component T [Allocatelliglobosispora scoriae]MBB5869747.1 energy-coupling factor transport system permease protein [Allocatelliglobosispora scoriae]
MTGTRAPLARRAPVAKIGAVLILSIAVLTSRDPLALGLVIGVSLLLSPFFGIAPWTLLRRAWPALLGAATVIFSLALFAADRSGDVLLHVGPLLITTTVLDNAVSLALRLIAVALPSVLVFSTTDPTDLADSLMQHAKAPPRFAIGALAAFRLVGLFSDEWRLIAMARRARGIDAGLNPIARLRTFASTAFTLLVSAIRRGTRLATAMDARGFDAGLPRSVARPMPFSRSDWLFLAAGTVLAAAVALITHR